MIIVLKWEVCNRSLFHTDNNSLGSLLYSYFILLAAKTPTWHAHKSNTAVYWNTSMPITKTFQYLVSDRSQHKICLVVMERKNNPEMSPTTNWSSSRWHEYHTTGSKLNWIWGDSMTNCIIFRSPTCCTLGLRWVNTEMHVLKTHRERTKSMHLKHLSSIHKNNFKCI